MKTILVDAVHTFFIKDHGVFEEMYDLLETYPNKKIVLTNANDEQMEKLGLDKVPYELFSLKHNPDKSDPEYYQIMLKDLSLDSKDVIYFEHNETAVENARANDITTYHYDRETKDLTALKEFLDANLN